MDFAHALTYIFEDKAWLSKLLPLMALSLFALVPLLGIPAFVLCLGYMLGIADNARQGLPRPLPDWENFQVFFIKGGTLLVAMIVYNLPLILLISCIATLIPGISSGFMGDIGNLVATCVIMPLVILYALFTWSLLAVAAYEYNEIEEQARFFRVAHLWDVMQANAAPIRQWAIYATLANVLLAILLAIPILGWLFALLWAIPLHGALLGQFFRRLSLSHKPKPKRIKSA